MKGFIGKEHIGEIKMKNTSSVIHLTCEIWYCCSLRFHFSGSFSTCLNSGPNIEITHNNHEWVSNLVPRQGYTK